MNMTLEVRKNGSRLFFSILRICMWYIKSRYLLYFNLYMCSTKTRGKIVPRGQCPLGAADGSPRAPLEA